MLFIDKPDYGPFATIVAASGSILAMGAALLFGWRGRAKWEPVEEDVPRAPAKVASLIAVLIVVIIWAQLNDASHKQQLIRIEVIGLVCLLISLLIYGLLNAFIYKKVVAKNGSTKEIKVIGGLWLNDVARNHLKATESTRPTTPQEMFAQSEYEKDRLWPRASQQLASMLFTLGYVGLIVSGTVALGTGAILTSVIMKT